MRLNDFIIHLVFVSLNLHPFLLRIQPWEDNVDSLFDSIKLYIAGILQVELTPTETQKALNILNFTTIMEHIGDIVKEVKGFEKIQIENSKITRSSSRNTTMAEISMYIGGTDF